MAAGLAVLILAIVYLALCDAAYRLAADRYARIPRRKGAVNDEAFSPWKKYQDVIEAGQAWFRAQNAARVTTTSVDGLTLVAHYLPAEGADVTLLLAHGYRSAEATFDFSCAFKTYHEAGYNLLLIDQRAHGESEGRYIGFGVPERRDIVTWAEFLNRSYHPRAIVLDGMSMGAATVLMSLDLPLPRNVVGAIADCGYTSPKAIIDHVMRTAIGVGVAPLWPGIQLAARLRSGHLLSGASALDALREAKVPVLFVHGEDDRYVPCDMGRANYAACRAPKQMVTVPGAGHGMSFIVDGEACSRALKTFLDSVTAE